MGMGGGPDSAGADGGPGGDIDGGGGGSSSDADVAAAISGAIGANVGPQNAGTNLGNPTGGATGVDSGMDMTGPASQADVGFDPSAAPVGVNTDSPQSPSPTTPGGLGPNPTMGLQMQARSLDVGAFLDSLKGKSAFEQERAVKAFLDDEANKRGLRQLSIDYGKNIDKIMGFGQAVPGLGMLHGSRKGLMAGLRALGFEPGVNTPEMDALESLAGRLGVSIDSRSGGIEEMFPGYRWDEETKTYKKITEENQGMLSRAEPIR